MADHTRTVRDWLAANPTDAAAVHVQAALDSADRYEHLCEELGKQEPGMIRVVICSYDRRGKMVITLNDRSSEARIAEMILRMHELMRLAARQVENDNG